MIRQVAAEDWERLRDVRLRALADAPEAFLETVEDASTFSEGHWRSRATPSDKQASFVGDDGTAMVSCFVANDPATVFLVGMWVAPERRGSGVAGELVGCVVDWARARGCARVCLSVEAGNDRAARLYEKCGFVETAEPPQLPYEPNPGNRFFVLEL